MAWVRCSSIRIGGVPSDGFVKRGDVLEATVPWRADIAVGTAVEFGGARYRVVSLRDPGHRHETLELGLEPAAPRPAKAEPGTRKKRKSQSSAKAGADDAA